MPLTLTRSLLVILIPGMISLAPWLLWLVRDFQNPENYYRQYPELVFVALFSASAVSGCLLESVNTWVEVYWDKRKKRRGQRIDDDWYDYLSRICPSKPVGYAYLSRMVTTLYFELAMAWAALSFGVGLTFLFGMTCGPLLLTIAISLFLVAGLVWSAKESHDVLCRTRREINARLGPVLPPFQNGTL